MGNGMSFKSAQDMTIGMQEKLAMKVVANLQQKNGVPSKEDIQREQARQIQQLWDEGRLLDVPCKIGTHFCWGKAENVWTVTGYYFSGDGEKFAYIEKNGMIRMVSIARLADVLAHPSKEK